MPPLTPLTIKRLQELEAAVLAQVRSDDPRVNDLIASLVRHAHAFVREARPTHEEWAAAIDFLIRVGRACTDQRNELILLMDMLGLTSAVDDVNFPGIEGATPSSVEGPFHTPGTLPIERRLDRGRSRARSRRDDGRARHRDRRRRAVRSPRQRSTSGRLTTAATTTARIPSRHSETSAACLRLMARAGSGSEAFCLPATRCRPTVRPASC